MKALSFYNGSVMLRLEREGFLPLERYTEVHRQYQWRQYDEKNRNLFSQGGCSLTSLENQNISRS